MPYIADILCFELSMWQRISDIREEADIKKILMSASSCFLFDNTATPVARIDYTTTFTFLRHINSGIVQYGGKKQ